LTLGFLDWLKSLFTSNSSSFSRKTSRRKEEEQEEIEELVALDII